MDNYCIYCTVYRVVQHQSYGSYTNNCPTTVRFYLTVSSEVQNSFRDATVHPPGEVGILRPAPGAQPSHLQSVPTNHSKLWTNGSVMEMKNNLVHNVLFFNTPFIAGCSTDPLGNNVAFCVGSASPPISLPSAEK